PLRTVRTQIPRPNLGRKKQGLRAGVHDYERDRGSQSGLAPPAVVTEATDAYFDDQDLFKQWLAECTEAGPTRPFISTAQLFASWKAWCDQRGLTTGSAKALTDALSDRGLIHKRTKKGRGFASLKLKPADHSGDAW